MRKRIILSSLCVVVLAILITGGVYVHKALQQYDGLTEQHTGIVKLEDGINGKLDSYYAFRDSIPEVAENWTQDQLVRNGEFNFDLSQLEAIWIGKINQFNYDVSQAPGYVLAIGSQLRKAELPGQIDIQGDPEEREKEQIEKLLANG